MIWTADAPSNIALIKYMGKIEGHGNRPTNTSLSYTLGHLRSLVQLQYSEDFHEDTWEPLREFNGQNFEPLVLSEKGKTRFLAHLKMLKAHNGFSGHFKVRSANDFPSDCGLASSASSFAALTKATLIATSEILGRTKPTVQECADLSRKGSGSSCRSFFSPWSRWGESRVSDVPELAGLGKLIHQVVVVDDHVKAVSSSEAHKRVSSSLLFAGRPERAELRVHDLIGALQRPNWDDAFEIVWSEFWDMHALFETSHPSFGYFTPGSIEVLSIVRRMWRDDGDGPLVTMDAGANVHLLYRDTDRTKKQTQKILQACKGRFAVIGSEARFSSGGES